MGAMPSRHAMRKSIAGRARSYDFAATAARMRPMTSA